MSGPEGEGVYVSDDFCGDEGADKSEVFFAGFWGDSCFFCADASSYVHGVFHSAVEACDVCVVSFSRAVQEGDVGVLLGPSFYVLCVVQ